jgi:hypothetical protein
MKKKCALILVTGDRIDYLDSSIKSCLNLIDCHDDEIETDIYLVSFDDIDVLNTDIKKIGFDRPDINSDIVFNFPRSVQQSNNHSDDIELTKRISLGHLILFGLIPDTIFKNNELFKQYDYILKSRTDLVFDFKREDIKSFDIKNKLLTFECFWGGCRYNPNFTNDQFVFGESRDVLSLISFPINECIMDKFWNPEQYMTYLFSKSNKEKIQISTDKYYLLSKDRESRKWIGFPLESINQSDVDFLEKMDLDVSQLKFTNKYESNIKIKVK